MADRVRAYVALGANVGDAQATLRRAVLSLSQMPAVELLSVSPLYRTRPVGVTDQPDFLNAVVALRVPAGPDPLTGSLALLAGLKQLEQAFGRRQRLRWAPRELDLDLLLFGRHEIRSEPPDGHRLHVPHAEMRGRLFVLAPLADLAARLHPPGWGESVAAARRRQQRLEGPAAVRLVGRWHDETNDWEPPPVSPLDRSRTRAADR